MKALVILFEQFSMQEISCATEIIAITGNEMHTCAITKEYVYTEDGFKVLPDFCFDEVDLSRYDCVILPGVAFMFTKLKKKEYASFLSKLKEYPNILIASISCSPVFLGAAGLLENCKYCGGLYDEIVEDLTFMSKNNFVHAPYYKDNNVITAVGYAYREFAFMIADHFHLAFDKKYFGPLEKDFTHMETQWNMDEELLKIWKEDLKDIKKVYGI